MLAPAAPHITEELWSRRLAAAGAAVVVDPRASVARVRRRPSSRRRARCRSRSTASCATRSTVPAGITEIELEQIVLAARQGRGDRWPAGSRDRIIHAGGGQLVNIVVR